MATSQQIPDVAIQLRGKSAEYDLSDAEMQEYETLFPNINVPQCLCSMRAWLSANPSKRPKNVRRFVANWLIRETKDFERSWEISHRAAR